MCYHTPKELLRKAAKSNAMRLEMTRNRNKISPSGFLLEPGVSTKRSGLEGMLNVYCMMAMHEALKAVVGNSAEAAVSVQWDESLFRATLYDKNEQIRPVTNAVGGCH
jgi:hypothetical protein